MKKSQIAKELAQIINEVGGSEDTLESANYIINFLVNRGMLPPLSKNPKWNAEEYARYADHPFLEYQEKSNVNEWEPE